MDKIFIIGDIHGNYRPFFNFPSLFKLDEKDTVICLGDFGGNFFFDSNDTIFKEKLANLKCNFFVIRGNHEERPSICAKNNENNWEKQKYFDNTVFVEKRFPYIKYALDEPAEYNINGHTTYIFPGAYSPDKWVRLKKNLPWFPLEQMLPTEMEKGIKMVEQKSVCDLVLSHTCPRSYQPNTSLDNINPSFFDNTTEDYLERIKNKLNYKLWCFGHYHTTKIFPKEKKSQVILLDNSGIVKLNNFFENEKNIDDYLELV